MKQKMTSAGRGFVVLFFILLAINGLEAQEVQFGVKLKNGDLGGCNGTLIAPRTILTAAHCLEDAKKIVIVDGCVGCKVKGWKHHPNFEMFEEKDLGLVFLKRKARETPIGISTTHLDGEFYIFNVGYKPGDSGLPLKNNCGSIIGVLSWSTISGREASGFQILDPQWIMRHIR